MVPSSTGGADFRVHGNEVYMSLSDPSAGLLILGNS
jgi:hypothetical protein